MYKANPEWFEVPNPKSNKGKMRLIIRWNFDFFSLQVLFQDFNLLYLQGFYFFEILTLFLLNRVNLI